MFNSILGGPGIGAAQGALGGALAGRGTSQAEQDIYNQTAQQYTQALAQSMMATKQAAAQNIYTQAAKPFNPNELEAYTAPLSNLVTLWQAKFGDEWTQKFDDEFWYEAAERLKAAGKLEVVKHTWYRIKEDA